MTRIALVTGGIGGIGTAACVGLASQGRRVVATYRPGTEDRATTWQKTQKDKGCDIAIYAADVSDFASCRGLIEAIERDLGPVEILVNNAGITRDSTLKKMSLDDWLIVINADLNSVFNMTKQVFNGMLERGWGRVVNISSINGQKGQFGQTNYSAAKAGVHGFTKAAAREGAAKGVTVNTISPGYVDTAMVAMVREEVRQQIIAQIPIGRLGTPGDVARTVVFLTDDAAGYITGADFSVNGGLHMY
jgi:acetoacetyl-CoA reductase